MTVADTPFPVASLPDSELTTREREIVTLIAHGYSNVEIAQKLFLSINSVKTYIRSAYRRIGVERRTQAVIWAFTNGLLVVDEADDAGRAAS